MSTSAYNQTVVSTQSNLDNHSDAIFSLEREAPDTTTAVISGIQVIKDGYSITVHFFDATFTFHSQWLHDAEVSSGLSKDAPNVYTQKPPNDRILRAKISGRGLKSSLDVDWADETTSQFPAAWLRVYAPIVAQPQREEMAQSATASEAKGWLATTMSIPEISYNDIFPKDGEISLSNSLRICDALLDEASLGILKVIDLPAPDVEGERRGDNALVTHILNRLFGSVFKHPRRKPNTTFNIASDHEADAQKGNGLPNYNTNKVLLTHTDMSHYVAPSYVQGLYALEGYSENTFASCLAALATMTDEAPDLVGHLYTAPVAIGRVADWYTPTLYQATYGTVIMSQQGFPHQIKGFRWHPHLVGSILSPYNTFHEARAAHKKFQEILRRDTHQLKVHFKPGDMYIWDNFRVLHGRECVLSGPRTSVGQTVPEQVVMDKYRDLKMEEISGYIPKNWLVHTPQQQLNGMAKLVKNWVG